MRASSVLLAAACGIGLLVWSGCQGSKGAAVPVTPLVRRAPIADASGARKSGVYRTWVDFHKLGLTQLRFSIERPSSARPSYLVVFPFPPQGKKPHLKAAYYRAHVVLTKYMPSSAGAEVAGHAKLGHDLGTFSFTGRLGPSFRLHYSDARGSGRLVAHFVNPTHDSPFARPDGSFAGATTASPTAPPLVNNWRALPAPMGGYVFPKLLMFITGTRLQGGDAGHAWQVYFFSPTYPAGPAGPPTVYGVWEPNPCGSSSSSCTAGGGDWQAHATFGNGDDWAFGTTDWAPPNSDSTDGSWAKTNPYGSGDLDSGQGLTVEQCGCNP